MRSALSHQRPRDRRAAFCCRPLPIAKGCDRVRFLVFVYHCFRPHRHPGIPAAAEPFRTRRVFLPRTRKAEGKAKSGILPFLCGTYKTKYAASETTLSMLVSTPKPRVVRLKISALDAAWYSIAGMSGKATQYIIKIDIGGVTGVAAKVVGKQPPPVHIWVTANEPTFLRSDGPLYEDGPIWA